MPAAIDETHDPKRSSWVASAQGHPEFPIQNLPLGVFSVDDEDPRGGVAIGDSILDLRAALDAGLFTGAALSAAQAAAGRSLNPLMALGPGPRTALRKRQGLDRTVKNRAVQVDMMAHRVWGRQSFEMSGERHLSSANAAAPPQAIDEAPPGRAPPQGFSLAVLDVGQGLAVVVRTAGHTLLYDAGPAFPGGFDAGAGVVVPYLRRGGVAAVDKLMLSHWHLDHYGGITAVRAALPVRREFATDRGPPCADGQAWNWDGVRFEFLHPPAGWEGARRNNQSCVLRVTAGATSMLLTGDIERAAEEFLVERKIPRSDVLLVPHHGSRTSSSEEFIAAVAPRWAIVPAGYRNRFGHPVREVLERYARAGVTVLRTDRDGAISIVLDGHTPRVSTERSRAPRYWRRTPPV